MGTGSVAHSPWLLHVGSWAGAGAVPLLALVVFAMSDVLVALVAVPRARKAQRSISVTTPAGRRMVGVWWERSQYEKVV